MSDFFVPTSPHSVSLMIDSPEPSRDEAHLRAILDAAVDGIITINEFGIMESVNPAVEPLFGYAREEMLGQNVSMLMPPSVGQEHDSYLANYRRTGVKNVIGAGREAVGLRKDGSTFPMYLSVSEVTHEGQRFFTGVVHSLVDLKRAEQALDQERNFANSLVDTAHAIVLVLDRDAKIVRFNRFAEELTGYLMDDVRKADWFETFLPERERKRVRVVFERAIQGEPVEGVVNSINTKSGERDITWFTRALRDEADEIIGVLSIGHDITDLRDAQRQLVQAERLAAIGQMVTGLAHESRNALQRAQAALDVLTLDLEGQSQQLDLTNRIQRALEDLQRHYEEVKHYAAPIRLERSVQNLAETWRRAWADVAEMNGQSMDLVESIEGLNLNCRVDPYRLEQVFRNIFENAVAACSGPCTVEVSASKVLLMDVPAVQLSFRDNGPGFTANNRDQVFVPFFTTKQKGTGLGMAITRRIVEAHGGTIEVGDYTDGAEIIVTLPKVD